MFGTLAGKARLTIVAGAAAWLCSAAPAQLFVSPDHIVTSCSEQNRRLQIRVNNGAPQNPNNSYSVDMGLGVNRLRDPAYTVSPTGHCVIKFDYLLNPIESGSCDAGGTTHHYHTRAPKRVPWNSSQLVTLAEVDIGQLCPATCEVIVQIDYFYENDVPGGTDADQEATYDLTDCPPILTYAQEVLQARTEAVFHIDCVENPAETAQGIGPATGLEMRAYITPDYEDGLTRISFDMTDVPLAAIPVANLTYHLGRADGTGTTVGDAPVSEAEFQQIHVFLPPDLLEPFFVDGHLLYYVTSEEGEVLFTSDYGPAPRIVQHPQTVVVCAGQAAEFSVVTEGEAPLYYRWLRNGETFALNTPAIAFDAATEEDEGIYQVLVENDLGAVHSEYARLVVQQPGELPPAIVQPQRVPERWQNPDFQWSRDVAPHDKVDDSFDTTDPGPHDILVNFRVPVAQAEATWLNGYGTVQFVSQYVPTIAVAGVLLDDVYAIASEPTVAFIEQQQLLEYYLDVATQATKVSSGFYTPNTVADQFGLDGTGVNIAIVDSGVDDPGGPGITNADLPAALFGFDNLSGVPGVYVNPDDTHGHGTHVAGIALGRGTANCPPGVAPGAGLIDIRPGGSSAAAIEVLNVLIARRIPWNIGVVNMSIGWGTATTDGQDSISQHVNMLVNAGVVVVCAAGNSGPTNVGLVTPGAADAALTVANSQDQVSPDRTDDTLRVSSSRGPRASDGDGVCIDEFKPEITAPGTTIRSAAYNSPDGGTDKTGTSMASPHVAGVAALLLQGKPTLLPGDIRQALISTAEARGTPYNPTCDPIWDNGWGWGLIDAYAAASATLGPTPQPTNLGFVNFSGYVYANTSIETTAPPKVGVPNVIRAKVRNHGPAMATNVNIEFKIDYISASSWGFYVVGTVTIPSIAVGDEAWAEIPWTPQHPDHQCLKAEIMYAPDNHPQDNYAQRNITVAHSPVYFRVENLIRPEPLPIEFVPAFADESTGWTVQITPQTVVLAGGEFAIIEALPVPPDGTPDGEEQTIYISSIADGCILLGGVAVRATMNDCNNNGIDDWFDIQSGFSQDLNDDHIPDECVTTGLPCPGDLNCDGVVDYHDIDDFIAALSCPGGNPSCWSPSCPWLNADCNEDGVVNYGDIDAFVARIGIPCP